MITAQLITDCTSGVRSAQEQLYRLLSPKLFALCLKYSRNYEQAQDNLQESFLLLFEKIESYKFEGSFEGWAKRLTINYILQQYRDTPLEIVTDNMPETADEFDNENDISEERLLEFIQQLPQQYRLVFNLYVLDEYSHKEIAESLNISIGTSKSNLARAKAILKEKIERLNAVPLLKNERK